MKNHGLAPSVNYPTDVQSVGDNESINFNVTNKNQLIPHSISGDAITNNNNTFTFKADLAVNWYGYIGKVYLKAGETYTIWSSAYLGYGRIGFSTSSTIVTNDTIPDITIISSASTYLLVLGGGITLTKFTSNIDQVVYLYYCSDVPRTDTSAFTISIQIEKGDKTTYIDHKGEEISLPVQKPFRKIGDYADKFIKQNNKKYEKHNIYKYILNGTEDWTYNASSQEFAFNDSSVIAQLYRDLNTPPPVLSSHYKITAWLSRNKNLDACVLCYGWTYTAFRIKDDRFTNVNDFKAYLTEQYNAGKPVYFVLILATPELIECTQEQEEALYKLEHLLMYEDYTLIECVDEIEPYIQFQYWYNNELNNSYGTRLDEIENDINNKTSELDNKIDEVDNKNNYSTTEKIIGTWIDGKLLYRRVLSFSYTAEDYRSGSQDLVKSTGDVISNLSEIDYIAIKSWSLSNGQTLPAKFYGNADRYSIGSNFNKDTIRITFNTASDYTNMVGQTNYIVIEYTKTTN